MALLNEVDLRKLARARSSRFGQTVTDALNKSITASVARTSFDIFLSHSYLDRELILGISEYLENFGYSVYVDWKQDAHLDRENVTKETAELVRKRIEQSASLFFATTEGAKDSKWMPWELGYMDGKKGKSAILPVSREGVSGNAYKGREYLGIYPFITRDRNTKDEERLWVREDERTYVVFEAWLKGERPRRRD